MYMPIKELLQAMRESFYIGINNIILRHPVNREWSRLRLRGVLPKAPRKEWTAQRFEYYHARQLSPAEIQKADKDERRAIKIATIGIIAGIALIALMSANAVFAISDPDTLKIDSIRAYSGVIDATGTKDLLVVVEYEIDYAILPAEPANEAFICRFMRAGVELNAGEIYPFNDKGYGRGVCSFYWTVQEKNDDSIEFSDPSGEAYEVCVQGTPTAFATPPKICATTIEWRDATKTESLLETDILNIAGSLELDPDWAPFDLATAISGARVLTASGEDFFLGSIPNLNAMAPDIFTSGVSQPFVEERSHPKTYSNTLQNFWANTPVDTWLTSVASFLQMQKIVVSSLIALFIMGLIVWIVTIKSNGHFEMGLLAAAVVLPFFVRVGWFSMAIGALVGFMAILAIGWAFFLRRAG